MPCALLLARRCRNGGPIYRPLGGVWSGLKANVMFGVQYKHPLVAKASQLFAYTLHTCSLNAQLHQLVRNFCGLTLDFTAKADHTRNHFALDDFERCRWGKENQGDIELVCYRAGFISQCLDRWSRHCYRRDPLLMQAFDQMG